MSTNSANAPDRGEMDDERVEALLRAEGTGVLSLTDGERTYGVPLSFGYDGDSRLYFNFFQGDGESRKTAFAETTGEACFTVYVTRSANEWQSVMVFGTLRRVESERMDEMREAIRDNAWYPDLFLPAGPELGEEQQISLPFALEVDRITGVEGPS